MGKITSLGTLWESNILFEFLIWILISLGKLILLKK
jgi:hypothetical protein